ncbi:MAG: hypothetical protein ACXWT1_05690 [Methylobacter sp.]
MSTNLLLAVQDHLGEVRNFIDALISLGMNGTTREMSGDDVAVLLGVVQDKLKGVDALVQQGRNQKPVDSKPPTPAS